MGQVFDFEIIMDIQDLRLLDSKNYIFNGFSLCACVCYQHIRSKIYYSTSVSYVHAT